METQNPQIVKPTLRKKKLEKSGFLTSDYPTNLQQSKYYGNDTTQKYRSMEHIESPELNLYSHGH